MRLNTLVIAAFVAIAAAVPLKITSQLERVAPIVPTEILLAPPLEKREISKRGGVVSKLGALDEDEENAATTEFLDWFTKEDKMAAHAVNLFEIEQEQLQITQDQLESQLTKSNSILRESLLRNFYASRDNKLKETITEIESGLESGKYALETDTRILFEKLWPKVL